MCWSSFFRIISNSHVKPIEYFFSNSTLISAIKYRSKSSQWKIKPKLTAELMYRSNPKPLIPPGQTAGHLTFLKNFGQIPRYIARLDGQMPHPLELQRESNPPPSRHAKATVETSSAKFSATMNFLFSLSSLHTLNKGIFHDRTI